MEWSGLTEFIKKLDKFEEKEWQNILATTAKEAKRLAKEFAVKDTHELEKSIYLRMHQNSFELGATARHAVFNEYGCYNIEAGSPESPIGRKTGFSPFLRPAARIAIQEFAPKEFRKTMKRIMHG